MLPLSIVPSSGIADIHADIYMFMHILMHFVPRPFILLPIFCGVSSILLISFNML